MKRKIEAMHEIYGYGMGMCDSCQHLLEKKPGTVKCRVYGEESTENTDWKRNYVACGLIGKPFPEQDRRIVLLVGTERYDDSQQIAGQITMDLPGMEGTKTDDNQ